MPNPAPFTPPIAIPSGQRVIWSLATVNTPSAGLDCSATSTDTTGFNDQGFSTSTGASFTNIVWSGFPIPSVLTNPSTVIHGIYPTFCANTSSQHTVLIPSCSAGTVIPNGSGNPWNGGAPGAYSGQWRVVAGTNLSVFSGLSLTMFTQATDNAGPIADFVDTTFVGIAIYVNILPLPTTFVSVSNGVYANVGHD